jgi:hypothetical protein
MRTDRTKEMCTPKPLRVVCERKRETERGAMSHAGVQWKWNTQRQNHTVTQHQPQQHSLPSVAAAFRVRSLARSFVRSFVRSHILNFSYRCGPLHWQQKRIPSAGLPQSGFLVAQSAHAAFPGSARRAAKSDAFISKATPPPPTPPSPPPLLVLVLLLLLLSVMDGMRVKSNVLYGGNLTLDIKRKVPIVEDRYNRACACPDCSSFVFILS